MAKTDIGKKWEAQFKAAWETQFPDEIIFRLKDQMTGYKETSENPCDFLCYNSQVNKFFMVECKEHKKLSIPFSAIPQYDRLLEYKDYKNTYPGCLIWFSEKDTIIWVSIEEMEKMVKAGEKSIGLRMLKDKSYNIIEVPYQKLRVFLRPDCNFFLKLEKQK